MIYSGYSFLMYRMVQTGKHKHNKNIYKNQNIKINNAEKIIWNTPLHNDTPVGILNKLFRYTQSMSEWEELIYP